MHKQRSWCLFHLDKCRILQFVLLFELKGLDRLKDKRLVSRSLPAYRLLVDWLRWEVYAFGRILTEWSNLFVALQNMLFLCLSLRLDLYLLQAIIFAKVIAHNAAVRNVILTIPWSKQSHRLLLLLHSLADWLVRIQLIIVAYLSIIHKIPFI